MRFLPTKLPGAYVLMPERQQDERGFFARVSCEREFASQGLNQKWAQCSVSFNYKRGTLRGLHYQAPPHAEVKVVRCTRGAIFDVMLDLRPDSPTFGQWVGTNLTAENRCLHYLPAGLAHGFQTLSDDTEVFYQISEFYVPELARGVRWDDPAFAIAWPLTVTSISAKDRAHPDFDLQGMRIDPPTSACSPERVAPRGHAETRTV